MDNWIKVAVLLIAFLVWLISHLARPRPGNQRTSAEFKPFPLEPELGNEPERKPMGKKQDEVERFLEMIRKRKEPARPPVEKEPAYPPQPPPVPEQARSQPPTLPVPRGLPERKQPQRRLPREESESSRTTRREPTREAVLVAQVLPMAGSAQPASASQATLEAALGQIAQRGVAAPVAPAIKTLFEVLKTPKAAQTAVLLREVLDRPRCKRPYHF